MKLKNIAFSRILLLKPSKLILPQDSKQNATLRRGRCFTCGMGLWTDLNNGRQLCHAVFLSYILLRKFKI